MRGGTISVAYSTVVDVLTDLMSMCHKSLMFCSAGSVLTSIPML